VLFWRTGATLVHARSAAAAVEARHAMLVEALDAVPAGFSFYDRDHRLVAYNRPYNDMIRHIGGLDRTMIGWTYDDVLTHLEKQMRRVFPDRDLATWKAEYLRRFREREGIDLQWEIGQTMRLAQVPTPSGGTVVLRMDVTDLKRGEQDAHAARRRFDVLVNSLSDAVFSVDRDGRFSYASDAMLPLTGYRPDELIGRLPRDIVHPDDHAGLRDAIAALRGKPGMPVTFRHRGLRKDGSLRRIEVRMTAMTDDMGDDFVVTGVARDVEDQHEMQERLHYELQRLDSVVQSSGVSIVLVDRVLRIVMANRGFLNVRPGRTMEAVVGRALQDVVDMAFDYGAFRSWFDAAPSQPIVPLEYQLTAANAEGMVRTYIITANPVRDAAGRVQHIVFLGVDHTDRRAAELQLFDSSRLATVGEMASGVAHEINQPLTVIRFAAENLAEQLQELPSTMTAAELCALIDGKLARIIGQTERAALIIQELKNFARKPDETPKPFDVAAALQSATQLLREQVRLSRIEQEVDIEPDCPPVLGHAGKLQQVILNLIINARDAILEHGAPAGPQMRAGTIRIAARHRAAAGKVIVTVEDDGPGIAGDVLPRLFEPFFTTKPVGQGTGLGLSVGYQIIRQMGGTITAENRTEGGARFIITLDAMPAGPVAGT
jgi:PAS domain S-box-containing protein